MNRAGWRVIGLASAVILLGSASAHADSDRCNKYAFIPHDTTVVLSTTPAKICAMEVQASSALAFGLAFDSPDGTITHGQTVYVADPSSAVAGQSTSTGKIDRFTRFGLSVQASGGNVFVSWDDGT